MVVHQHVSGDLTVDGHIRSKGNLYDKDGLVLGRYTHSQISASHEWVINHESGRYASSVFIMDGAGVEMRARVTQPDANQVVVYHDSPKSGTALLIV